MTIQIPRAQTSASPAPRPAARYLVVLAVSLLLTGCGPDERAGPPPDPRPSPPAQASTLTGASATVTGPWGTYPDQEAACLAVTDDVLFLAQLPPHLGRIEGPGNLQEVADRLAFMAQQGPPELQGHYAHLHQVMDAYPRTGPAGHPTRDPTVTPSPADDHQTLPELSSKVEQLSGELRGWLKQTCR